MFVITHTVRHWTLVTSSNGIAVKTRKYEWMGLFTKGLSEPSIDGAKSKFIPRTSHLNQARNMNFHFSCDQFILE